VTSKRILSLAAGVLALALAVPAQGSTEATQQVSARMDTRQVVTVKNKRWKPPASVAAARGTFAGTLDTKTRKLTFRISYAGVGKPSLAVADIHVGPRGKFGAVIVRLCGPCRSGQKGARTIKRRFVDDVVSGNGWVTVITEDYPNGVIRGQIKAR
jgi:CHRD domain